MSRTFEDKFTKILELMNVIGGDENEKSFTRGLESIFAYICALNKNVKKVTLAPKGATGYDWMYETTAGTKAYCQLKTGETSMERFSKALGKLMLIDVNENVERYVYSTDTSSIFKSDAAVNCTKAVYDCNDIKKLKKYCYGLAEILGVDEILENENLSDIELLKILKENLQYKTLSREINKFFKENCKRLERV